MANARSLTFGYKQLEGEYDALWGARLIIDMRGRVDFLFDRQSTAGRVEPVKLLVERLNKDYPVQEMAKDIREKIMTGEIHTRKAEEILIREHKGLRAVGNSNASAGYFYVTVVLID